jgi:diguanylate cyclase (GGDEF)-like protein
MNMLSAITATSSYLSYEITELFCFFFALTILLRIGRNLGSYDEIRYLKAMIYAFFAYLIFDIFSYHFEDQIWTSPTWVVALINAIDIMAISFGCYFWFRYVQARSHLTIFPHHRLVNALIAIPLIFIVVADIVSIWTGWLFTIDAAGSYKDKDIFWIVQGSVNYLYLVVPALYAVVKIVTTRSRQERIEYSFYACYMVAPLTAGILESYIPYVPILALNMFLVIQIIFLFIQDMQINSDALTGLNNRRQLNHYLAVELPKASEDRPIIVLMMDINGFKSINDKHGHSEGDHALQILSEALKEVATKNSCFVARYGGDEFCLLQTRGGTSIASLQQEIQETLSAKQKALEKPLRYTISISIGGGLFIDSSCSPEAAIKAADRSLYNEKKKWHAEHGTTKR